jgi:pilus assembly protein CpaB
MNMNSRNIILMCVALVVAGLTAYLARGWLANNSQKAPQAVAAAAPSTVEVLVAQSNIPTGSLIKQEQLRWQPWPEQGSLDNYVVKGQRSMDAYVGAVARQVIGAGEPINDMRVVKPGEQGFMAAVLTPGMRAITVPINDTSGIAGFVFPGDRVDLVLSHAVPMDSKTRMVSETVLTNVRILAIDQAMNDPVEGKAKVGRTATLEVTPKQVEKINVARQLGGLSLSLRPLQQNLAQSGDGQPLEVSKPETGTTHTWDSEVSRLLPPPHQNSDVQTVQVSRGDKTASQNFRRASK